MLHCPQPKSHAINVEEQKVTGGRYRQDQLMRHQPILLDVQNAEILGEVLIKYTSHIKIINFF